MSDASSRPPEDEREARVPVNPPDASSADAPPVDVEEVAAPDDHELTEQEVAAQARDAYVRRAPKISAFITTGVLLGALVGLVAALIAGPSSPIGPDGTAFISVLEGQGSVRLIMTVSGAVVGALVGAGLAVLADRRSVRGRPEQPPVPRTPRRSRRSRRRPGA